ncbi:MAG: hypothetical protein HY941_13105 [Gammaproteobacteria bacterium]|nr:hypothetical protein [Gammaproteobacteria bacterium]
MEAGINQQREALSTLLAKPLARIAAQCGLVWPQRELLNQTLASALHELPYCMALYAMDTRGLQICDNVEHTGVHAEHYGRDRSERPYMRNAVPASGFLLSDAYLSLRARRPSITAIQVIRRDGVVVGFLGADFDLRDLPLTRRLYDEPRHWQQLRGDPAIRSTVFQQCRIDSEMDRRIDDVLYMLEALIVNHGVFQGTLHFSSSRATVWLVEDPFRYRLLDLAALVDPDICLVYPQRDYPGDALVPADQVRLVLQGFRDLRLGDETIYLRSGSLNIFNGMVALTFSCDGSHYMPYAEFLDHDMPFWLGR